MIVNHWGPAFTQLYGHYFPETYLSIDTEYTGGNAEKDLVCEWGHVMVENRMIIDRKNIVLNWFLSDVVPKSWLRARLRYRSDNTNGQWRITEDVMRTEGIHPLKALEFIRKLCETWQGRNLPFVAQNGYYADERMLKGNIEGFLEKPFRFGENGLIDTGAIHKASLAIESDDEGIRKRREKFFPVDGDTLESYFRRVTKAHAKGVYWNLKSCLEYYELDQKHDLDLTLLHNAEYDAWCTHLLFEEYRNWITHNNSGEVGYESPQALARMFDEEMAKSRHAAKEQVAKTEKAEEEFDKKGAAPKGFNQRRRRRGQRSL